MTLAVIGTSLTDLVVLTHGTWNRTRPSDMPQPHFAQPLAINTILGITDVRNFEDICTFYSGKRRILTAEQQRHLVSYFTTLQLS
jgi:hypothetical protein